MSIPSSILALVGIGTLSLFLTVLNFAFWRIQPQDRAPLWVAGWLAASVVFTTGRIFQYLPLENPTYDWIIRLVLSSTYALAWLGYELANTLTAHRVRPWERIAISLGTVAAISLLWTTGLIATHQVVLRVLSAGSQFHGLEPGQIYVPVNLMLLAVGTIGPVRLLRASSSQKSENRVIAAGYVIVLLCAINDFVSVALGLRWPRLLDFSYLPMAMFFTYVQVNRMGRLYRDLDLTVQERTSELNQANEILRAEVAERKQAQQALQVSEELYHMLFDANPHPSWVYDAETLAFLLVNDAAIAAYGYSREEFLAMTIQGILPADDNLRLPQDPAGDPEALMQPGQATHCKKDGTLISVDILSHSLLLNGRPAHLTMVNDITQRLQAESALQESEERYRTLVENARDGVTIVQDGLIKYANSRLAAMVGLTVSDLLEQPFDPFIYPDERGRIRERYMRRNAGFEEPNSYETALIRQDGARILVEFTIGNLLYQAKPAEIVIVRDISEHRLTEQALQRQLREMTVLNTVATAGSEATHVDGLIDQVTDVIAKLLYPDNCGVLVADDATRTWHPHRSYRGTVPELLDAVHSYSEGIAGKSITDGRTVRVNDVRLEPVYQQATPGIRSELAVPIMVNGRVFGCLNAESRALYAFTAHDERLMSTIAENLATAIEKIRLLQVEQRRREEAEILYNTTRDLVIERDLSKLLHVIVERAAGMLGATSGALDLCEPENRLVRCAVSYNTLRDYTGTVVAYGEGTGGLVAETGEPLIVEDYRTWPGRSPQFEQDQPFISMISLPMRWQGRVIGVIHVLDNTKLRSFSEEDVRMLDLFANQAAMAVENARLFKETSQRAQQAAVLAEVGRDISESLELDVTLGRIASYAKELLRARTCAVYVPETGIQTFRAIAALGPYAEEIKNDPVKLGEGILGSIALQRMGEVVNNVDCDPRAVHIAGTEQLPVEHLMGVPVLVKDQLTGLIGIWRVGVGQEFTHDELDFLTSLAGQVGVAIENARLFDGTRRRLLEIEGLHVVSTALRTARTLEEALPIILQQLMSLLNAGGSSLEMVDPARGDVVTRLGMGAWERTTGLRTAPGMGVTGEVIASLKPYVSTDVVADGKTIRPELFGSLRAAACVPIMAQHQPIGALWIGRETPILDEEVYLLSAVGEMVGNAIHRMMLNEETERRANEFEALYRSATGLAPQSDLRTLLNTVVTQAKNLLHSSGSDVMLYEPDHDDLLTVVETGDNLFMDTRLRADQGLAGRVFREQRPLIVDDYHAWPGRSPQYEALPLAAVVEVPITFGGEKIGVLSAYESTESKRKYTEADARLLSLFAAQAAGVIRTARLLTDLRNATNDLSLAYDTTLEGWARALELRDKETLGHSRRVSELTLRLARRVGIPESEMTHVRRGVLLHDIGKMGIPDMLLKKTGPLNSDEWVEMRKHPTYAHELLEPIAYLRPALDIPYCHHEQWNGSGYPRGLKGSQIPLAARIFTIVDVYDALSHDRPYRGAWPMDKVIEYIREQSGKLFDPEITDAFLELIHENAPAGHAQAIQ